MKVEVDLTEYGFKAPKWYDPINPHVINASGGSGGNDVEITWAEYEALSEEEKMNGSNYFITDIGNPKSLVKKELLKEECHIGNYTYTLNESIKNFDYIVIESTNANGGYRRTSTFLNVSEYYNDAFGCLISYKQNDSFYASINLNFNADGTQAITVLNYYNQSFNPSSVIIRITGYRYERVVVPNQMVNYSTVEQRIGTWIDGKPLYQKSFEFNYSDMNTSGTIKYSPAIISSMISNLKETISIDGILITNNYGPIPIGFKGYAAHNNTSIYIEVSIYYGRIGIITQGGIDLQNEFNKLYVTVQYTKTTD